MVDARQMVAAPQAARQGVGDFYVEVVLPQLAERLDTAFPEFGWRRDARGWVATNQEMTHQVFGVRADRVVAHGPAPRGFLIHGGPNMLWTEYLNGGALPRGERFAAVVREIGERAGVDTSPLDRPQPRDRRADLLHDFFTLCRMELHGQAGAKARAYLERHEFPPDAIDRAGLGVVPNELFSKRALETQGYSELEVARSGVLADGRWPGRLCGAWRDEGGRIRTMWARSLADSNSSTRYLYLSGASRSGLLPYGLAQVLRLPPPERPELLLVEGLIDVHQLRARGLMNVAAAGGSHVETRAITRLRRLGFESVVLALDNDAPGRDGLARTIEAACRAKDGPALRVLEPTSLGDSKDPDAFVRAHGLEKFRALVDAAGCAVAWRALEFTRDVTVGDDEPKRRAALARAGDWLGALPARLALEQEDAIRRVADRCGYTSDAVSRAFRARYWKRDPHAERPRVRAIERP